MKRVVAIYLAFAVFYFALIFIAAWFSGMGAETTPVPGSEELAAVIEAFAK